MLVIIVLKKILVGIFALIIMLSRVYDLFNELEGFSYSL